MNTTVREVGRKYAQETLERFSRRNPCSIWILQVARYAVQYAGQHTGNSDFRPSNSDVYQVGPNHRSPPNYPHNGSIDSKSVLSCNRSAQKVVWQDCFNLRKRSIGRPYRKYCIVKFVYLYNGFCIPLSIHHVPAGPC